MKRWAVVVACGVCVATTGCDPVWGLRVTVRDSRGTAIEGAALTITGMRRQNEHSLGTVSQLTDDDGEAQIGSTGTQYPEGALVTIARPGFVTQQFSFEELCGDRDLEDCDRVQHRPIVLVDDPP